MSTLILVFRLGLGLPTGLFPLDFLTKIFRTQSLSIWLPGICFVETSTNHETPQKKENEISKLQSARRTTTGQLVGRSSDRCLDPRSWLWAGHRHRYSVLVTVKTALTIFVLYSLHIPDLALSSRISRALRNIIGTTDPGQALRVPGVWSSHISRQLAHECGGVVSPMHPPLLPLGDNTDTNSVRGWVDPRATVRSEGLYQLQIPMTPSGIKPATFLLVAQCLNQLQRWRCHTKLSTSLLFC
jgi:hypothetical protein